MPSQVIQKNYSKCPLKKRPVNYDYDDSDVKDEPENLSIKREYTPPSDEHENSVEKIVDVLNSVEKVVISPSLIAPTPTYPSLQPWNFHIPYTTDYYRSLQFHHHQQPLRGDLHSPSSPSEGSLSPPPSYLQGRSSSVSPPIRGEIYRPVGIKQNLSHVIKPEPLSQHRFVPYHHHLPPYQPYALTLSHQPPVSPSYSDMSFYSARSHSPESNCSVPEDLSVKNTVPSQTSHRENSENFTSLTAAEIKEKVTPPRYQCPDCNKSYSTFSGLTKHQQFHCPAAEGNQAKKSFSCKDCDKTYVSLGALKMHIRTHTLPCKCTICGKAFSRPWLLQGHIRTHTGEKPFSCQYCHRAFADRSNLRAHLQTHSDIKKYSCTTCSKTFSRMSLLTKHNEGGCPGTQITNSSANYLPQFQERKDICSY